MTADDTLTLEALAECTEVPQRTIRYYIQRGLVPRPHGEKKGAYYDTIHVEALLQIRKWISAGMSLERIHALLNDSSQIISPSEPASLCVKPLQPQATLTYRLAPWLTITLDPETCPLTEAQITAWLQQTISDLLNDKGSSR